MISPKLLLILGLVLVVPAVLPSAGNLAGEDEYDVVVVSRVEWHNHLRYWEVDEPAAVEETPSRFWNYGAILSNMLFFGASDAKTYSVTLHDEAGRTVDTITQKTPEGGRLGTEDYLKVVFRRVAPGEYVLRAQILEEDGRALSESSRTISVGGG